MAVGVGVGRAGPSRLKSSRQITPGFAEVVLASTVTLDISDGTFFWIEKVAHSPVGIRSRNSRPALLPVASNQRSATERPAEPDSARA